MTCGEYAEGSGGLLGGLLGGGGERVGYRWVEGGFGEGWARGRVEVANERRIRRHSMVGLFEVDFTYWFC